MTYIDVIVKFRVGGEEMRNVYTIKTAGAFDTALAAQAANALYGLYGQYLMPVISSLCTLYEVAVRNVSEEGFPEMAVVSTPLYGQAPPQMLPAGTSGLLVLKSNSARPNRGMRYIPCPDEDRNTGAGVPTESYLQALRQFGDALVTDGGPPSGYEWVIARRGSGSVVVDSNRVTIARGSPRWGMLNSRRNGR